MKHYYLIIAFGFLFSCTKQQKEEKNSAKEDSQLAEVSQKDTVYESLQNEVKNSWGKLTQNELQRVEDLNRLILEVSYIPSVDDAEIEKVQELTSELNQYIYNQNEIPEFNTVAQNDKRIEEIVGLVFGFSNTTLETTDKEFPFIKELKADIRESIQKISELSSAYSEDVQNRNTYISENQEQLESMGYQDLKPLKSFFDTPAI